MVTEEVTEEEKVIKRQYSQSMEIESGLETPLLRTSISVKAPTQFVNTAEQRHKWKSVATRERKSLKGEKAMQAYGNLRIVGIETEESTGFS